MESMLGFAETTEIVNESCSYKLVPWLSWNEWDSVRESLFSSSPSSALNRISAWRSRGCIPDTVDITASIVEIQQRDNYYRAEQDQCDGNVQSEELLAMMYCMAIIRLVNGVVEKTRQRHEVSIAEAADAIGFPRMLIDIRHESSHRGLPSLPLLREASTKALNWLKFYYWDPQKEAIVYTEDGRARRRKKIKSKLLELAFLLQYKFSSKLNSSVIKGKLFPGKSLYVRSKVFGLMTGKLQSSKSDGPKKQINKAMKKLVQLYLSSSSEVASVLLDVMLKARESIDFLQLLKGSENMPGLDTAQIAYDDWKHVITKLSNKEPELLLTLLKAVLDMIEDHDAIIGEEHLNTLENGSENCTVQHLSYLFVQLVRNLKALPSFQKVVLAESADKPVLSGSLLEIMRKCLLVSTYCNHQLMESALILAEMMSNTSLMEKIKKLSSLGLPNREIAECDLPFLGPESVIQQESYLHQAAENMEKVKLQLARRRNLNAFSGNAESSSKWVVTKSWNPCPIGLLPCSHGSSGLLPNLNHGNHCKEVVEASEIGNTQGCDYPEMSPERAEVGQTPDYCGAEKVLEYSAREMQAVLKTCTRKREASSQAEVLNDMNSKRMRETMQEMQLDDQDDSSSGEGVQGRLMIDGVWKKVGQEELHSIQSAIRILV